MGVGTCILFTYVVIYTSVTLVRSDCANCDTCDTSTSTCTVCSHNYYQKLDGCESCAHTCVPNGAIRKCRQTDGYCEFGCTTGFYGDGCTAPCSSTCKNNLCERNSGRCSSGCISKTLWGHSCLASCPSGCSDGTCNQDGDCLNQCKPNYYNDPKCDKRCDACSQYPDGSPARNCDLDTGVCLHGCSDNTKWGPYCNISCPTGCDGNTCNFSTGHCSGNCTNSTLWGDSCEHVCSSNCHNGECNKDNGNCLAGCAGNMTWGPNCSESCPDKCSNGECNLDDGTCLDGCSGNTTWGPNCSESCPEKCSNGKCNKDNGTCLAGCSGNMTWGPNCSKSCPGKCSNGECNLDDGTCLDGCSGNTTWGPNCSESCPEKCSNGKCNKDNGTCLAGCSGNMTWGPNCSESCPDKCSNGECNKDNGTCLAGCSGNMTWGPNCSKSCPGKCSNGECNLDDGTCLDGCSGNTTWGPNCSESCPDKCSNGECNKDNGTCLTGCSGNMTWGPNCSKSCPGKCSNGECNLDDGTCLDGCSGNTTWGPNCSESCPERCSNDECNKEDGTCLVGCSNMTWGPYCNSTCPSGCDGIMCDFRTGHCSGNCTNSTAWGDTCDHNCSTKCNGELCNKTNGHCLEGCLNNRTWGPVCLKVCPITCYGNTCDNVAGNCLGNCVNNSLWGDNCEKQCSVQCKDGKCNKNHGTCTSGCANETIWGSNCSLPCPSSCNESKCGQVDGLCSNGCINENTWGYNCGSACPSTCVGGRCNSKDGACVNGCHDNTTWGPKCDLTCPNNCKEGRCKQNDGRCIAGCVNTTLWGKMCNNTCLTCTNGCEQESGICAGGLQEEVATSYLLYILVACGLVVIVTSLLIVLIKTKRAKRKTSNDDEEEIAVEFREGKNNMSMRAVNALTTLFVQNPITRMLQRGLTQTFGRRQTNVPRTNKLEISHLLTAVLNMEKSELEAEFESLGTEYTRSYEAAIKSENLSRNTYPDIYPYDDNRVMLPQENKRDTSYINASYIKGFYGDKRYIAAQGPSRQTKDDFWKMVWMEDVQCIVMLSGNSENEFKLIDRYLPDPGTVETFGNISVCSGASENYADFVTNAYTMRRGDVEKHVMHLQFTSWEGGAPPISVCSLIEFHQKYRAMMTEHINPHTVVHCTAGVGRTGVFMALDILTDEGLSEGFVDILACVAGLRDQRVQMVQTQDQYEFLYKAVAQTLGLHCQLLPVHEFGHHGIDLEQQLQKCNVSLDLDTEEIQTLTFDQEIKGTSSEISDSLYKSASSSPQHLKVAISDTYRHKEGVIMTQTPNQDLAAEFCRLVMETKCSVILMLNEVEKNQKMYWPKSGSSKKYGAYKLTTVNFKDFPTHVERELKLESKAKKSKGSLEVKMVQYKGWTNMNVLPEPDDLLKLEHIVRDLMDRYPGRPLLVHCSDGATQSGLFCVVHDIAEKLLTEKEISVINSVRRMKGKAKTAIPTLEQFQLCYDFVSSV